MKNQTSTSISLACGAVLISLKNRARTLYTSYLFSYVVCNRKKPPRTVKFAGNRPEP